MAEFIHFESEVVEEEETHSSDGSERDDEFVNFLSSQCEGCGEENCPGCDIDYRAMKRCIVCMKLDASCKLRDTDDLRCDSCFVISAGLHTEGDVPEQSAAAQDEVPPAEEPVNRSRLIDLKILIDYVLGPVHQDVERLTLTVADMKALAGEKIRTVNPDFACLQIDDRRECVNGAILLATKDPLGSWKGLEDASFSFQAHLYGTNLMHFKGTKTFNLYHHMAMYTFEEVKVLRQFPFKQTLWRLYGQWALKEDHLMCSFLLDAVTFGVLTRFYTNECVPRGLEEGVVVFEEKNITFHKQAVDAWLFKHAPCSFNEFYLQYCELAKVERYPLNANEENALYLLRPHVDAEHMLRRAWNHYMKRKQTSAESNGGPNQLYFALMQAVHDLRGDENSYFTSAEAQGKLMAFVHAFYKINECARDVLQVLCTRVFDPTPRETMTILQGPHGCGKTWFAETFIDIFGGVAVTLDSSDYIVSQNIAQALNSSVILLDDLQVSHLAFLKNRQALIQGTKLQQNLKHGHVTNNLTAPPVLCTTNIPLIAVHREHGRRLQRQTYNDIDWLMTKAKVFLFDNIFKTHNRPCGKLDLLFWLYQLCFIPCWCLTRRSSVGVLQAAPSTSLLRLKESNVIITQCSSHFFSILFNNRCHRLANGEVYKSPFCDTMSLEQKPQSMRLGKVTKVCIKQDTWELQYKQCF